MAKMSVCILLKSAFWVVMCECENCCVAPLY